METNFDKIKRYYDSGLWTESMLQNAVAQGAINGAQAFEIIGTENVISLIKQAKIRQMSKICGDVIVQGIQLNGKNYSMKIEDQLNIMSLLSSIQNGALSVPYHADGEECRLYTASEFFAIAEAATNFKIYQESYFNSLRIYINAMETIEELDNITYGMEIPEEYQTEVLKQLINNG